MNRQQVNSQKSTLVSLAAISLSSVEAKATEWLWKNWLPLGKLVLFAGEGEQVKLILRCRLHLQYPLEAVFLMGRNVKYQGKS